MATPTRSRLKLDQRRDQLLDLGREIFGQRPYDEISIDEIAAAARISKGLLYHYFPSKRDFYVEVIKRSSRELGTLLETDPKLPPLERLSRSIDAHLSYIEDRATGYLTVMRGGIGADDEVRAIVDKRRESILRGLMEILVGPDTVAPALRYAVRAWIGGMESACLDWLERRDIERDALRDLLVGTLVAAVQAASRTDAGVRVRGEIAQSEAAA